jgi:isoquinoline 1-oxidoreductase beta subunit
MTEETRISRRKFLIGISATAAGTIVATVPGANVFGRYRNEETGELLDFSPNIWISIDIDGIITVMNSRGEMGQGTRTTMAMLVAEELEADWEKIRVEQAPGDQKYGNQSTGGSYSVQLMFNTMRTAGAVARLMLITAAAQTWGINESQCRAENSYVIEISGSRKLSYGELAEKASTVPIPLNPTLKDPKDFKVIGTRKMHIDSLDIVTGKAKFGIDVIVPGMKFAAAAFPPTVGGSIKSFDDTETLKIKGVIKTVRSNNTLAVIADNTWAAIKGVEALKTEWYPGPNASYSSEDISKSLYDKIGKLPDMPGNSIKVIEGVYEVPYLAHSTMEPMNCTADYKNDSMEVWASTQDAQSVRRNAANGAGLNESVVKANSMLTGGGFGRRLNADYASIGARISKLAGMPVKFMYTKSDCLQNDNYRPTSIHAMKAGIGANGASTGWAHKAIYGGGSSNPSNPPYKIGSPDNSSASGLSFLPTGAWRSVSNTQVIFANESFIDEIAFAAGIDPMEWRLNNFNGNGKLKTVLETLKEKSDWGKPLPAGWGRGVALFSGYGAYAGHVVEVSVSKEGNLKVERIVAVCDNNLVINPLNVESQILGAAMDGLSTAIKGEITIRNGSVEQSNWHDFEWCRIDETPKFEIHLIPSGGSPSGMGEVGFPSVTPALVNAIFNATGIRVRKLPISKTPLNVSAPDVNQDGSEIRIFPNPGDDHIRVEYTGQGIEGDYTIELLDIIGRIVFESRNSIESGGLISELIRLDSLSQGVYFVRISFSKESVMKQFIKS